MDAYGPEYVTHNLPLLVLSGLGPVSSANSSDQISSWDIGAQINSEIPPVQTDDALVLRKHFEANDGRELAWNGREDNVRNKFWMRFIGRDYSLPPRHAQIASPRGDGFPTISGTRSILHSPLSPLTPGSRVFPDGLIDSRWIQKHQQIVPSAYVSFYVLSSDSSLSSVHDNQVKTDINHVKNILSQSGYKTRFIAVMLSELKDGPDVEDRLTNIRKATGLDLKSSLYFLPPHSSAVELQAFVEMVLSTIYPLCIEYYRDLSKHSRRKRNRGVVPPTTTPTGTLQNLSGQGWNVRYDFKLGVFAEFRQEIDAAVRSYESGYDALLGTDVFGSIASWSPRWNEARLLADIFTIRVIRCLLWNGNTTAAVRRWQMHHDKIRAIVDSRGKGSSTYGWEAWVSRFAEVMGQLIQRADLAEFAPTLSHQYLPTEKSILPGDRTDPWEYLHHPGYWFRVAAKHSSKRRDIALAIPEDDRNPPGQSPASQIASRTFTYDTYLCPEPHEENPLPTYGKGVDHSAIITNILKRAIVEFEARHQPHLVQEISLQIANEYIKSHDWHNALQVLRPLWQSMTYRQEGYWNIVEEIGWSLRNVATRLGDGGSVVAVDWELLNRDFTFQSNWHYDLSKSLEGLDTVKTKPALVLHDHDTHSFLGGAYTFERQEGKVGESCLSQLAMISSAFPSSAPVALSEIIVEFEGSMKPIVLRHIQSNKSDAFVLLDKVQLEEGFSGSATLSTEGRSAEGRPTAFGTADLTIRPGQTRIFEFITPLREAGEAKASRMTFRMASNLFDLDYILTLGHTSIPELWWSDTTTRRRIVRTNAASIHILPKPPKMSLQFTQLQEQYYTNESIVMQVEITNGEEEDAKASLDLQITGENVLLGAMKVLDGSEEASSESDNHLILGNVASGASKIVEVMLSPAELPADYKLSIQATYSLVSDPGTPISQSMSMQLPIISPFEANYDFSPRVHPDPWPSFFTHEEFAENDSQPQMDKARGLAQKWCLTSRYASFAEETLIIDDVDIKIIGQNGNVQSYSEKLSALAEADFKIIPKTIEEARFSVYTQKNSLDDRGTATLDASLVIKWRRDMDGAATNKTILPVPRLLVSSSEPRVLASISYSDVIQTLVHFDVTIENPSYHFLTFGLSMEPSEEFAFSGIKQSTLQLVPLSRRTISFRLLPSTAGNWVGPVRCVIRDRYFQKVLRIAPTEGMKLDKEGILIWVPPVEDDFGEVN